MNKAAVLAFLQNQSNSAGTVEWAYRFFLTILRCVHTPLVQHDVVGVNISVYYCGIFIVACRACQRFACIHF